MVLLAYLGSLRYESCVIGEWQGCGPELDTSYLTLLSLNGVLYRSRWPVGNYLDFLNGMGKLSPLWAAPFPRQGFLNSMSEEAKLSTSKQISVHSLLSALDGTYAVTSYLKLRP